MPILCYFVRFFNVECYFHQKMQPHQCLTEEQMRFYAAEVLLALEYLHAMGFVYRDLKPENILLHESGHIRLTDFDLSKASITPVNAHVVQSMMGATPTLVAEPSLVTNSFVGTLEYFAPEVIVGRGYGASVDWWTFGILMYEMLYGHPPFQGRNQDDTFAQIKKSVLKFPEHARGPVSKECKSLIKKLLTHDPKKRLGSDQGAAEIKAHPFFKEVNLQLILNTKPPIVPELTGPKDFRYFSNRIIDDDPEDVDLDSVEPAQLRANHPFRDFMPFDRDADAHAKATGSRGASKLFKKSSHASDANTPQKSGSSSNISVTSTSESSKPKSERSNEVNDSDSHRTSSSNDSPTSSDSDHKHHHHHSSSHHHHSSDSDGDSNHETTVSAPLKRKKSPTSSVQLSHSISIIKRSSGSVAHADSNSGSSGDEHMPIAVPKPHKVAHSKTPVPDAGDYSSSITSSTGKSSKHMASSSAPDLDHVEEKTTRLKKSSLAVFDADADTSSTLHRKKSSERSSDKPMKKNTSTLSDKLETVQLTASDSLKSEESCATDREARSSSRKSTPTTSKHHSRTNKSHALLDDHSASDSDEKPILKPKKSKIVLTKPDDDDESS